MRYDSQILKQYIIFELNSIKLKVKITHYIIMQTNNNNFFLKMCIQVQRI